MLNPRAVFTQATSSHEEARSPRTNRIGRALRVAMPPAERFNTFESHPAKRHAPASFSCPRESPLVPTRIAARAHENRGSCPRGIALVVNPATTLRDRIGTNSFIHEIWLKQTILCERRAPIDNRAICNVHRLGHLNWCELSDLIPFQVFKEAAFLQPDMRRAVRPLPSSNG